MAAVNGTFKIARVHFRLREIHKVLPALCNQFLVKFPDEPVLRVRSLAEHIALLRHHNRNSRTLRAEIADERLVASIYNYAFRTCLHAFQICFTLSITSSNTSHIPKTIQHIAARVDGGKMFTHLELHTAGAGEAEVRDRHIKVTTDDGRECKTRTGGTSSMGY